MKVQLDYTRTNWNFETDAFRSRDEDLIAASLFYRFLPKTSAFVEYDFKNIGYDEQANGLNLDNKVNSVFLGLAWDIGANTKGTVKGGYHRKEFAEPSVSGISTGEPRSTSTMRFPMIRSSRSLVRGQSTKRISSGTSYYVTTGALAEFIHKFTYKISGVARTSYSVDDFSNAIPPDTTVRNDKNMLVGVGLKYQFKEWLDLLLITTIGIAIPT